MSYNWIDAATPQGRERLKELAKKKIPIPGRITAYGDTHMVWMTKAGKSTKDAMQEIGSGVVLRVAGETFGNNVIESSATYNLTFDKIEFLDPEPRQPEPHKDEIKCPNSLLSLADAIVEAIYKARNTEDEEWGKISHPLLLELWLDAIDDAWNRRDPDQDQRSY